MLKSSLIIIFLILVAQKGVVKAQFVERLDRDRGFEAFRLGTDLSTGFYLDHYINRGAYLEPLQNEPYLYMGCEVMGIQLYHSNYQLQEIVLFLRPQYEKILKNRLFTTYGKPLEFEEKKGLRVTWKGKIIELQVDFKYQPHNPEDDKYKNAIAVYISYVQNPQISSTF